MRIGILISGRGASMVALLDSVRDGRVRGAEIALVLSDRPWAAGRLRAKDRGIKTALVERKGRTRAEHEREIIKTLREHGVELVCLAGYMRLLSPCFVEEFRGRILNIHPSLLPAFPGLDAQRQAVEHGGKYSGWTVHFVDETLDGGPIITQRTVPVLDTDTPDTLAARILAEEHKASPEALALVCSGAYETHGHRVIKK